MRRLLALAAFLVLVAPAEAAAPQRLLVEAREFRFTLSRTTVKPGKASGEKQDEKQDEPV